MSASHFLAGEHIKHRDNKKTDTIGDHQKIKHGAGSLPVFDSGNR
jgi:hypothetical protein